MNWFLNLLVFVGYVNCSISQEKAGIVNVDSFVNIILTDVEFDSIYLSKRNTIFELGKKWIDLFQIKSDSLMRSMGCGSPLAYENVTNQLVEMQNKIIRLDEYLENILPKYKEDVLDGIECLLIKEYYKKGEKEDYQLIVDKSQILYMNENNSYLDFQLKNEIDYEKKVIKIIEQFILKTDLCYHKYYLEMKKDYH